MTSKGFLSFVLFPEIHFEPHSPTVCLFLESPTKLLFTITATVLKSTFKLKHFYCLLLMKSKEIRRFYDVWSVFLLRENLELELSN